MKKVTLTFTIECTSKVYDSVIGPWIDELKTDASNQKFEEGINSFEVDSTVIDE